MNNNVINFDTAITDEAGHSDSRANDNTGTPFQLRDDGLYYHNPESTKPPEKVSSKIWVEALTRRLDDDVWGMEIHFENIDSEIISIVAARDEINDTYNPLSKRLERRGFLIQPKMSGKLREYLSRQTPEKRKVATTKIGWHQSNNDTHYFVQPNVIYTGETHVDTIVYQPENYSTTSETITIRGSLKDWQDHIAEKCKGNPYLLFGLCIGFSAPLQHLLNFDSGGFHICGLSSRGKTTMAQVAASIYGCGSDPATTPEHSYIARWNMTNNATEVLALSHNDHPLIIDELGTSAVRDFGKAIYDLAGGKGKAAMTSSRDLRPPRTWRVTILSTGEYSVKQQIEQTGQMAKAGQLLRMIDIPAGDSIIEDGHGMDIAIFANNLKIDCGSYYGSAGHAFISQLVVHVNTPDFIGNLKSEFELVCEQNVSPAMIPEESRAIKRFSMVELAGKLASRMGIISIDEEEIELCVSKMINTWHEHSENLSDIERGIMNIIDFIHSHQNRFRDIRDSSSTVINLVGYKDHLHDIYYFTEPGFKQACGGHNHKAIAKSLRDYGYLATNNNGPRLRSRVSVSGFANRLSLYAVNESVLDRENVTLYAEENKVSSLAGVTNVTDEPQNTSGPF